MSAPQHIGDLIFPCSFGHFETCTVDPSSLVRLASTRGALQLPQVALTDMPHEEQVYVAMGSSRRIDVVERNDWVSIGFRLLRIGKVFGL